MVNSYFFYGSKDFLPSSSYFSSIVITIIFYHVECVDGTLPRILVDSLWIPRSKHMFHSRVSRTHGRASVITFFPLIRAFSYFSLKVLVFSRYSWIFASNIPPHFTEFERIKLAIKRKLDTNRLVSEIQQIWKDLLLLDSPNVHPQLKKKTKKGGKYFNCKWCISLLIEHW